MAKRYQIVDWETEQKGYAVAPLHESDDSARGRRETDEARQKPPSQAGPDRCLGPPQGYQHCRPTEAEGRRTHGRIVLATFCASRARMASPGTNFPELDVVYIFLGHECGEPVSAQEPEL
jgi:hypothetical protein